MTPGAMLLVGVIDTGEFTDEEVTEHAGHTWWWTLVLAVLAVAGLAVQLRSAGRLRESTRDAWAARGA